ncbi:MAG: ribosomal protein S18-alanine N-acetyltransferase [Oscillospiraceae bacterium]|jgi:ribosomal-protein-alanine N-acetyltransferase|nr:ribosomal protein S18-alanine N-acetyltransferase [Oscillospiraceae bacterium]
MSALPENMLITRMRAKHLDRMAELEKLCFGVPWTRAMLKSELKNPLARYFVMEENGVCVGYAGMQCVLDEGYITNIAADPTRRRVGIGRALLGTLVEYAKRQELSFLTLEVRRSNLAAQALYAGAGFATAGVRPGYYRSPDEDALLMTLTL